MGMRPLVGKPDLPLVRDLWFSVDPNDDDLELLMVEEEMIMEMAKMKLVHCNTHPIGTVGESEGVALANEDQELPDDGTTNDTFFDSAEEDEDDDVIVERVVVNNVRRPEVGDDGNNASDRSGDGEGSDDDNNGFIESDISDEDL